MLTKSDFLLYLEAPLHLWADKHGWLDQVAPSRYELHLMEQGKAIEKLAQEYLQKEIQRSPHPLKLTFQRIVSDRYFHARLDALVYDPEAQVYDIYEIKSGSSIKKETLMDMTFQLLVAETEFKVRHTYLIHVNKEYIRRGALETSQLFQIVNVDEQTEPYRQEVLAGREAAWQVANLDTPDGMGECLKPKACPCPGLCHPDLPNYSIFELPRLHFKKARQLKAQGMVAIKDIPEEFPLTERQKIHVQVVRSDRPQINQQEIEETLSGIVYPLSFLDYETYNPAVPEYDGYRPYQHIVFQYSLHIFNTPSAEPLHHEFLSTAQEDPARSLLLHLLPRISTHGSVVVWNKGFETGRNREMAKRYPEFAAPLENINARIFDLMEVFSRGSVVHADFHGSASIKNVLPVLVKDLSYADLPIPQGDEAMMAWVDIIKGQLSPEEVEQTRKDLLRYCAVDTMAMVKIWQALLTLISK